MSNSISEEKGLPVGIGSPSVNIGFLTKIGLFVLGSMSHIYRDCPPAVLIFRGGIGWVLIVGMLLDLMITCLGWWPIVGGWSVMIALMWVVMMLTIDRAILRSMDGGQQRQTKKGALVLRITLICLQVCINTGLTMMLLMGDSVVKFENVNFTDQQQKFINQKAAIQTEYDKWLLDRQETIDTLTLKLSQERSACTNEAINGNPDAHRNAGVGPVAKVCLDGVAADEKDLNEQRARLDQTKVAKESALKSQLDALNLQMKRVENDRKTKDGLYGRIFLMMQAFDKMSKDQPLMVYAIYVVDVLVLTLQLSPFVMQAGRREDEYDLRFAQEMWGGMDGFRASQEDFANAQLEKSVQSDRRRSELLLEKRKIEQTTSAEADEMLIQSESKRTSALEAQIRLNELKRKANPGILGFLMNLSGKSKKV